MRFAFSQEQFHEVMKEWGLRPKMDLDKIARIPYGGFIQKKDAPLMHETFARHHRELQAAMDADPTGEGFIKDMFLYELENHEYSYTGTAEDALDSLGLSFEDVAADPRLKSEGKSRGCGCDYVITCYTDHRKKNTMQQESLRCFTQRGLFLFSE